VPACSSSGDQRQRPVTKSKFDNLSAAAIRSSTRSSALTDVMIAARSHWSCCTRRGQGRCAALRALSAQVVGHGFDPICALVSAADGRLSRRDDGLASDKADIFVTATGNYKVVTHDHMAKMKDEALVCNIVHFDNESTSASLDSTSGTRSSRSGPHRLPDCKKIILLVEGSPREPGCGTGIASYVMSSSFANQTHRGRSSCGRATRDYPVVVYVLPKHLDEKVARLQLTSSVRCSPNCRRTGRLLGGPM